MPPRPLTHTHTHLHMRWPGDGKNDLVCDVCRVHGRKTLVHGCGLVSIALLQCGVLVLNSMHGSKMLTAHIVDGAAWSRGLLHSRGHWARLVISQSGLLKRGC